MNEKKTRHLPGDGSSCRVTLAKRTGILSSRSKTNQQDR